MPCNSFFFCSFYSPLLLRRIALKNYLFSSKKPRLYQCSIQEVDRRKQAKEKFSQSIFFRLYQYNPKIYLDVAKSLEEPDEQSNTLDF
ncbi:TPA: hypothetical protein JBC99_16060 [Legionella pneumophila subsp. pneumophila]|nr:hypothetical protein [Legionella pneumophila subsp. pneumophila]